MARIRKSKSAMPAKVLSDTLWRIALYIRLSREDGNDESESVVNQKKILNEYLTLEFDDPYTIIDYYIDDGLTGTDDTRAEFTRMVDDIEHGKVNCVICKTLARAFRNYADQGRYLEFYFPLKKIRFISTGDPKIDTFKNPDAITGLEVPITGLMNDRFASRTSSDIRRTFDTKRRRGEFIGAFPPYGFLKDPEDKNRLILDPDIVPIKHDMRRWIVNEGMSLRGVALRLNELGIPNPSEYKRRKGWNYKNSKENDGLWNGSTVKLVLLNKANIGYMIQGRERIISYKVHDREYVPEEQWYVVEGMIEPTFTLEEYQTLKEAIGRDTRAATGKRNVYLFSGFMRCADCKGAMHRKASGKNVYYICCTFKDKNVCSRHAIREDELIDAVLEAIKIQITTIHSLADIIDKINESLNVNNPSSRFAKILADKQQELAKAQTYLDNLYPSLMENLITREAYIRMSAKYESQIVQTKAVIKNLQAEKKKQANDVNTDSDIFKTFVKYENITALDRSIIVELVDTIYVYEGKRITIKFRFSDKMDRILEFIEANSNI